MKSPLITLTILCQLLILPCNAKTAAELLHEGRVLGAKGSKKEANAKYDEALKQLNGEEKSAANLATAANIHQSQAFLKKDSKNQMASYRKAVKLLQAACAKQPKNQLHQLSLAGAIRLCADRLRRDDNNTDALTEYAEAQKVLSAVTQDGWAARPLAFDQWMLEVRIADTLNKTKKYQSALPHYEKAAKLSQSLIDRKNPNSVWIESHATTLSSRGSCLMNLGQKKQALASYDQAISIMDQQIAKDPGNKKWKTYRSWYVKSRSAAEQKPLSEQ